MAPIASYLATAFFLIHVSLCAPIPQEKIAHQDEVLQAISNFKAGITSDPKHVTDTWKGLPPPTNGKHKESSSGTQQQEDYQKQQDDYYKQQKQQEDQEGYWKKQQNDQQDDWQTKWWKDYYHKNGNGNDNQGYPQPPDWQYPGWKGKFHSSGDHTTPNWNGWGKGGCPDPTGIDC